MDHRVFTVKLTPKGQSIILGDEKQYAMIEHQLKNIIETEEKYQEFEVVITKLTAAIKEKTKDEKEEKV